MLNGSKYIMLKNKRRWTARDKHLKLDMNKVTDAQSESPFLIMQLFHIQPCQKLLPKTTKWLKLAHQCSLIYLCEVNNDRFAVTVENNPQIHRVEVIECSLS